ncbi:hypothetical protein A9Q84_16660 [Halobacteriovorax marinus]|uniref:Uncharacterized protein n=1 Tax=Halobacteriovorax marinus TaxID=97084 RepID=A0A1Y5F4S7_9BACT|nr:hypothetical protein A9Q84_16660 [Halobacteriovorax marinus]
MKLIFKNLSLTLTGLFTMISVTTVLASDNSYTLDTKVCPSIPQKILVIDQKSGWWAGDGGDFGLNLMNAWKVACEGVINFEYRHRTYGNGSYTGGNFGSFGSQVNEPTDDGEFPKDPWNTYSQIWLLSGGEADSVDLRTTTKLWKRYQSGISKSGANIFIGGGFGNVYHANALTNALGLGSMFIADREAHEYPTPSSGVNATAYIKREDKLNTMHPLFEGVDQLVGDLQVGSYKMVSDHLTTSSSIQILTNNPLGKPVIGIVKRETQKMIFDAGVHRTYGILAGEKGTLRYLQNIAVVLAK